MANKFYDDRLPENCCVFLDQWNEYVVCEGAKVAQIEGDNVRCGKTKGEALIGWQTTGLKTA